MYHIFWQEDYEGDLNIEINQTEEEILEIIFESFFLNNWIYEFFTDVFNEEDFEDWELKPDVVFTNDILKKIIQLNFDVDETYYHVYESIDNELVEIYPESLDALTYVKEKLKQDSDFIWTIEE